MHLTNCMIIHYILCTTRTKSLPWQTLAPSTVALATFSLYAEVRILSGAFLFNRNPEEYPIK
jgi:hypothetical protein